MKPKKIELSHCFAVRFQNYCTKTFRASRIKNFLQEYLAQNAVLKMNPNNDKYFKSKINFLFITRKNI